MKREEQLSFASTGFEKFSRPTKRAVFLKEMDAIVPWHRLTRLIEPHYPKGDLGRPPIPLERMLRIHFLQQGSRLAAARIETRVWGDSACRG